MVQRISYIQIDLENGEATSLLHAEDCVLRCLRGTLWVTEDNGGGDVVLEAGDHYALTRRGRTVVQSVGKHDGAGFRVMLARSPRRCIAVLRGLLALWRAGHTKLRRFLPRVRPA